MIPMSLTTSTDYGSVGNRLSERRSGTDLNKKENTVGGGVRGEDIR